MTIREMNQQDTLDVLGLILRNCDEVMAQYCSPQDLARLRKPFTAEELRNQMAWREVFVAQSGGRIAATDALAHAETIGGKKHWVSSLFVSPDAHGRGIGTSLLNRLIELARSEGLCQLRVPSSVSAIPCYERAGFVADETHLLSRTRSLGC